MQQQEKHIVVPDPNLRVGDVERDTCVATLTEHHLQGRLSVEEVQSRHRAALVAVRVSDLDALLADLPGGHRGLRTSGPARARTQSVASPVPEVLDRAPGVTVVGAATALVPAGVIVGASALAHHLWMDSNEGALLGGLFVGTIGYATHAVRTRGQQRLRKPR